MKSPTGFGFSRHFDISFAVLLRRLFSFWLMVAGFSAQANISRIPIPGYAPSNYHYSPYFSPVSPQDACARFSAARGGLYFWDYNAIHNNVGCWTDAGGGFYWNIGPWALCPDGSQVTQVNNVDTCPVKDVDPNKNAGPGPCSQKRGNPINVGVGNKYQEEIDYQAVGQSRLRFVRRYNSLSGMGVLWPSSTLGWNWHHQFERSIHMITNAGVNYVVALRPDTKALWFAQNNGQWQPDSDVTDALVQQTDGSGKLIFTMRRLTLRGQIPLIL